MIESGGAIHCVTLGLKQHLIPRLPESLAQRASLGGSRVALGRR
jgi:hypothetical protein